MKSFYRTASLLLLVSPCLHSQLYSQVLDWGNALGPYSGSVYALSATGTMIVCGGSNGVFRSLNEGLTWSYSPVPHANVISSKQCDEIDLIGTFGSGVYKSYRGAIWDSTNNGLGNLNVWAMIKAADTLYAGTSSGVYITTNCGVDWTILDSGIQNRVVNCFAVTPTAIYAGTTSGLYRHLRGIKGWIRSDSGLGNFVVKCLSSNGKDIVAGTLAGVFRSTDAGRSWQGINTGLSAQSIRSIVWSPQYLFIATNQGLFRSSNSGDSWHAIPISPSDSNTTALALSNEKVFAGTVASGLFMSTDNGLTWELCEVAGSVVRALHMHEKTLRCGSFLGIWQSKSEGENWTHSSLDSVVPISLINHSNSLFCATMSRGVFRSTDNGISWHAQNSGLTDLKARCLVVHQASLVLGTSTAIWKSIDSGVTWGLSSTGVPQTQVNSICSIANVLLAATQGYGILKSSYGGASWISSNSGMRDSTVLCLYSKNNIVYAGSSTRHVYWSTDQGETWLTLPDPTDRGSAVRAIQSVDSYLIVAIDSVGLMMTSDSGKIWHSAGLQDYSVYCLINDKNTLYAGTNGSGVYRCRAQSLVEVEEFPFAKCVNIKLIHDKLQGRLRIVRDMLSAGACIQMFSLGGQLAVESASCSEPECTIDVSSLPNGLYFVRIAEGNTINNLKILFE